MLINLHELDAGYGSRTVLSGVNLQFEKGCAGLLGPNGAGKSTLLKTIMGFLQPLGGKAEVLGLPVPQAALQVRSRIGYMPETESFISGMSTVQYLAYMGRLSGLPAAAAMERAHEVLQYVGLGEARYRNLETYSLGMKQRAKLAQAIVHDPALLLLDEPTNGMDPEGRREMLELVQDLVRNKGMAVILCSHLLNDVENVADQIIVLGNGRVISRQVREDVIAGQADRPRVFAVRVKDQAPAFIAAAEARGLEAVQSQDTPFIMVALPAGQADTRVLFELAQECGTMVQRLEERKEKLEDVFVKAVGELGNAHL